MTPRIVVLCLLLAAILAACDGGSSDPTPTPSASPTARPSNTPSGAAAATTTLAEAERLYAEGSFEEAITAFETVSRTGPEASQDEAAWRLAQVHFGRGSSDNALAVLEPYVAENDLAPERERQAMLLLGNVRLATGDLDGGEEALRSYIETGGPATPYAQIRLAGQLANNREYEEAIEMLRVALLAGLPPSVATSVGFDYATYLEEAGHIGGALNKYDALSTDAADEFSRGEALWLRAELSAEGDPEGATNALHQLIESYPWHDRALEALDSPLLALTPPTTRQRAVVLFNHRLNDAAAEAWTQIARDPTADIPEAHYHLGILAERYEDYEAAIAHYDTVIAALSGTDTPLLGQALWDRALVLELLGRTDEAIAAFAGISEQAPSSEHAAEGLYKAAWYTHRSGNPGDALDLWLRYGAIAGMGHQAAEAHFWAAQSAAAAGDAALTSEELSLARDAAPLDFYGLRAAAEIDGTSQFPANDTAVYLGRQTEPIEAWLTTTFGPEDPSISGEFESAWARGLELRDSGLTEDADAEFDAAVGTASLDPWALYRLTLAAEEEDLLEVQTRAATELSRTAPGAPSDLFVLVYPVAYKDLVNEEAPEYGVDPYLLLALMRQESLYTPDAGSPAGALGLMQIIPDTGDYVAQQLGEAGYTTLDLFRPKTSIKFGAWYLGGQLDEFGGRPEAALAAYNGGPGNAGRWLDAAGLDRDIFIETIDFSETRAYVELVLENYALYLWAYGITDQPSIPFGP